MSWSRFPFVEDAAPPPTSNLSTSPVQNSHLKLPVVPTPSIGSSSGVGVFASGRKTSVGGVSAGGQQQGGSGVTSSNMGLPQPPPSPGKTRSARPSVDVEVARGLPYLNLNVCSERI